MFLSLTTRDFSEVDISDLTDTLPFPVKPPSRKTEEQRKYMFTPLSSSSRTNPPPQSCNHIIELNRTMELSWIDLGASALTPFNILSSPPATQAPCTTQMDSSYVLIPSQETPKPIETPTAQEPSLKNKSFAFPDVGEPYFTVSKGSNYSQTSFSDTSYISSSSADTKPDTQRSSGPSYASSQHSTVPFIESSQSAAGKEYTVSSKSYASPRKLLFLCLFRFLHVFCSLSLNIAMSHTLMPHQNRMATQFKARQALPTL